MKTSSRPKLPPKAGRRWTILRDTIIKARMAPAMPVYGTDLVLLRTGSPHSTVVKFLVTSDSLTVQFALIQDSVCWLKATFAQMQVRLPVGHVDVATAVERQPIFTTVSKSVPTGMNDSAEALDWHLQRMPAMLPQHQRESRRLRHRRRCLLPITEKRASW